MRIDRKSITIIVLIVVMGGVYFYQSYIKQIEPVYTLEYDDLFNYSYYRNCARAIKTGETPEN